MINEVTKQQASLGQPLLSYPFGKEPNQKKYLSATVQSLERYATQLFNNNGLVGRVHFDVTPCDV